MRKNYIAIDLGASSGRAILGHLENGKMELQELHRFPNGPVPGKDGGIYWDLQQLFQEIKTGIRKAVETGCQIDGIGIDTWGVDICYLGKDGKLIGQPHHYRDARTAGAPEWLYQRIPREEVYRETGIQFMDLNTVFQLAASLRDNEEALKQADKLLFVPNALIYLLCGDVSAEHSIATTSQLYNPVAGDWSWKIIDAMGLPHSLFPAIQPACTKAGLLSAELQKELGCPAIPVLRVGCHDTASAVAAVPAVQEDAWAYLSSGTWSLMGVELAKPLITPEALAANYTNEGGVANRIRFLKNIMGLWLIQEYRNEQIRKGDKPSWNDLATAASEAKPFFAFINPNDKLFEAPGDMSPRIQAFCQKTGQAVPQTRGEICRVIFESLALRYRQTWLELEELTGQRLSVLHLVGGGCKNDLLNRLTANAIQAKVLGGPMEATAFGNILAQALAQGELKSLEEARKVSLDSTPIETFLPDEGSAAAWEKAYQRYLAICR